MPHHLFLDTEFTGFAAPKLISIGLASDTGEHFYAETEYVREECSEFVLAEVVPLLGNPGVFPRESLRRMLLNWLEQVRRGEPVLICYDAGIDRVLFEKFSREVRPGSSYYASLTRAISTRRNDVNIT